MRRLWLYASLAATVLLLGATLVWLGIQRGAHPPDVARAPLPPGGDFTLQSADGPVSLAGLRGQVVLIYFGYATCPDACPTTLGFTTLALKMLTPGELARVKVIFVSVDPNRDTPAKLRQYVGHFHPNIIGVTGEVPALGEVGLRYGAVFRYTPVSSAAIYVVDHTSITSVVAPDGRLVEQLPHGTTPKDIVAAIRRWL